MVVGTWISGVAFAFMGCFRGLGNGLGRDLQLVGVGGNGHAEQRLAQIHSAAGRQAYQRQTLIGLGLNKIRRTSTLEDTPAVRGMINKVKHLVKVDEG